MKCTRQDKNNFNILIKFLVKSDFIDLNDAKSKAGKFDLAVIMPGAPLYLAEELVKMYDTQIADNYIIAGGIGHSTHLIAENIKSSSNYHELDCGNISEAEMYYNILKTSVHKIKNNVFLDTDSTNCGSNSINAKEIADSKNLKADRVLIMQDATMQLRTHLTFQKNWDCALFSYSPLVPLIYEDAEEFKYQSADINGLWAKDRFISLLLGEMFRVEDNETGYGPKGKNFIVHIDLPEGVKKAYYNLKDKFTDETRKA